MAVMPLFVLTLAHFLLPGSRLTPYRIAGFAVGFSGVVIIIGPEALSGLSDNSTLWGALAVLAAALSYAFNSIYARRLGATDPVQLSAGMLVAASLLSLPVAAFDVSGIVSPGIAATASLAVLGLLSTGLATLLYFRLVQGPGPAFLSFVNYLVPPCAILAGALFLGETVSTSVYAGLAFILAGIALSELGARFNGLFRYLRLAALRVRTVRSKA
jgi:drug/metabolite transporter (DMT)-like permease